MRESGTTSEAIKAATPLPAVAPAPSRVSLPRPVRGAALWTTIGFVCGAIFWHAVGFWTFMSDMMFNGDAAAATHEAERSADPIETGSLPTIYRINPSSCTSLELNRIANRTEMRPCPAEGLTLRLDSDESRGDLALIADGSLR